MNGHTITDASHFIPEPLVQEGKSSACFSVLPADSQLQACTEKQDERQESEKIILRILAIYDALKSLKSLHPDEHVNTLFSELVKISLLTRKELVRSVLEDQRIKSIRSNLQSICARGEFMLESYWSDRISRSNQPLRELEKFPYYANYCKALRIESNSLFSVNSSFIERILFVGSGPLPLTSVCLAFNHQLRVDNVDIDEDAYLRGKRLIESLGLENRMGFYHCDIMDFKPEKEYDAVFLASLVGMDENTKSQIIRYIGTLMMDGALLMLRSSERLRSLIYPAVDIESLEDFAAILEIHPLHDVMNSSIIARKK